MPSSTAKVTFLGLAILFIFNSQFAECLIVPEEIPTVLSLVYSNIPPIKKGTDSRFGVGFKLGEHADFQVLVEYGPQKSTDPIGNTSDNKKKRNAILIADALNGKMGPLTQALAKYQMELGIKKLFEKYKIKSKDSNNNNNNSSQNINQKTESGEWLSKWSNGLTENSEKIMPNNNRIRIVMNNNGQMNNNDDRKIEDAQRDLTILKKLFEQNKTNETKNV